MNNFKNLLIAVLTGLLALSLFSQPAQSASNAATKAADKAAARAAETASKSVEYDHCITAELGLEQYQDGLSTARSGFNICSGFRP